jgi:Ca-activated chloride channel family protein
MRYIIIFLSMLLGLAVWASEYGVYSPDEYKLTPDYEEMTLFILDFSNSMSEYLDGESKADMMINTLKKILPSISKDSYVGLRVYGHRMGFTPMEACRASKIVVPIRKNSTETISNELAEIHPRGMTPITYSLKQAIKNDFIGFTGRKHIILLTDGGENCDESPCKFVMELMKVRKDVFIDVIAFNVDDEDDLDQLKCTSLVTGGKFYSANTAAELAKSFENSTRAQKRVEAQIITK